jgi:CubicO group peptidase (beta-lactamase class C family)
VKYVQAAVFTDGVPRPSPAIYLQNFGPAGGLVSTVDDLSRLAAALLDDRLLTRATRSELFRGNIQLGYVALGVWGYPFSDDSLPQPVDVVERQGEAGGYRASLILVPERHAWLVLLSNTDRLDFMTWNPASTTHRVLAGLLRGEMLEALLPPITD